MENTQIRFIRLRRYVWWLAAVWILVISGSLAWSLAYRNLEIKNLARHPAGINLEKDILMRQWGAGHGGDYVPATAATLINPADLTTPLTDTGYKEGDNRGGTGVYLSLAAWTNDSYQRLFIWLGFGFLPLLGLSFIGFGSGKTSGELREQSKIEEELQRSEEFTRSIVDSSPDCIKVLDLEGRVQFMNTAGQRLMQITNLEEYLTFPYPEFFQGRDRQAAEEALEKGRQGETSVFSGYCPTAAGIPKWWEVIVAPIFGNNGQVEKLLSVSRDITTQKQVEEELNKYREHLEALVAERTTELRHTNAELDLSRRDWEEIFQAIGHPVFILDPEFTILDANRATLAVLGTEGDQIIGRKCHEIMHHSNRPPAGCPMVTLMEKGSSGTEAMEVEALNGACLVSCTPVLDNEGRIEKIIHIATDITARRQAEQALVQSEKRFKDIAENSLEWIWEVDTQGKYVYASPMVENLLGYKPEEMLNKHFYDLFHPDDLQGLKEQAQHIFSAKMPFREFINRNLHKDGSEVWLMTGGLPVLDDQGELIGYRGADTDITARRQAERALAEEAIRRRILVEQSRDGIVVLDETGKVYEANQRYAEMLGYSPEEVRQLYVWDWDAKWTKEELLEQIRVVDEAGDHFDTRHRRRDGTIFDVEISTNGTVLAGQKLVFCVCRDISQRKAAERALRESEGNYRLLVKQIPAVVFRGYADWSIDCFDNKIEILTGYPKEDFDSRRLKWSDLILEEDLPAVKKKFLHGLKNGGTYTREYRIRKKSGEIIWVQVQGQIFLDAVRRIKHISGVIFDITERKQAEDELRQERDLSISIMESLPGIFYLFDEQGNLKRWNKNLEAISRYSSREISAMHPQNFFTHRDKPCAREAIQTCFATGEVRIEAELLSKNGSILPYLLTGRRIIMEGKPHLVGMGLDISDRRQMEEALRKRLVALSRPLDDAGDINFDDLFNLEEIQRIQDLFAKSTGVASLITTPEGVPITKPSNFCRLCSSIRKTELGSKHCSISDALIGRYTNEGPIIQNCLSVGLCNAGASITVGGKHIANWLIGQVRNETQTEKSMRPYARKLGIGEKEFIAAFREVPVMPAEQFEQVSQALFVLANQLSTMAYQNVQQARFITERRKAEAALKESESFLASIFASIQDYITILDSDLNIVRVNPARERTFADSMPMVGRKCYTVLHGIDRPCEDCAALLTMETGQPDQRVKTLNMGDRQGLRHINLSTFPLVDEASGKVTGVVEVGRDITEQKLAEEALIASEANYRTIFNAANDLIFVHDARTGEILDVNQKMLEFYGYSLEDVRSLSVEKLSRGEPPYSHAEALQWIHKAAAGEPQIFNWKGKDRSGRVYWLEVNLKRAVIGNRDCVLAVARDITKRLQAEKALQDSEKRYLSLFEDSPLSLWLADFSELRVYLQDFWRLQPQDLRDYFRIYPTAVAHCVDLVRIIDVNKATLGIYEAGSKEEIIQDLRQIFTLEAYQAFQNMLIALAEGHHVFEGEIPTQSLKGKKVNVLFKLSAIPGFGEIHNQVLVSIIDITERKSAEEEKRQLESQLLHVQKMDAIGTLAGGIAHDFNNILSALMGYTELALDDVDEGTETRENLVQVLKSGKRAKDLVKQILTFSRQDKKERLPVQVSLYTKEIIKFLRASLPTTIEIRQNITARTGKILADPTQLHQVLINLCTNAAQAMEESGGVLEIGLEEVNLQEGDLDLGPDLSPGAYLRLTVKDTGTGMDYEVLDRIFDPFFTTKKHSKGTGLGLAVVHGIVKSHDGRVQVFSEPGEGSCFQVFFPKIEGQDIDEDAAVAKVPRGQGLVLLVDDEPDLVRLWEQMLRRLGYQVVAKTDSLEALEAFKAQPERFNLVLTDQTMPQMTGTNLARQLLLIRPDIPIVLVTGYTETLKIEELEALGIRELITKPLSKSDLALVMEKVSKGKF